MKRLFFYLILNLLLATCVFGQNRVAVELQNNSSLTIYGSTNIIPFSLIQKGEKLSRSKNYVNVSKNQNKISLGQNLLSINVKDFKSDNKKAQYDFRKLVKADLYPQLHLQVLSLETQLSPNNVNQYVGNAIVSITITNVCKQYNIPFSVLNEKDNFVVDGKKRISIRDFGLVPPIQMMGLIKVSEWIEVDFHLIFRIAEEKQD